MNDIKLSTNNEKELEALIHSDIGMELCHACNEKRQTTPYVQNGTTESRQNYNAWKKGNLQTRGDIGS